jgi:hypothetical protein
MRIKSRLPEIFFRRPTRIKLTRSEKESLAALCYTKAYEHEILPKGNLVTAQIWRNLGKKVWKI